MAEEMSQEQALAMQKENCIFCKIIKGEIPSKKVHEDKECVAILDINPGNEGHVLLLPKEHYAIMPQLPEKTLAHMSIVAKKISKAELISTMGKSTSIFIANGAAAGQKAPHFMMHIIPRKTEKEFFVIPMKSADANDLESVKKAIITKLEKITGGKVTQEEVAEKKEAPKPLPPPIVEHEPKQSIEPEIVHYTTHNKHNEVVEHKKEIDEDTEELLNHPRKIAKTGIKKEKGYLYYIDEDGDIARAPMARGGKKNSSKPEKVETKKSERKHNKINLEKIREEEHDDVKEDNSYEDEQPEDTGKPTLDDISRMLLGGKI